MQQKKSLFQILPLTDEQGWASLAQACRPVIEKNTLNNLRLCLAGRAASVVVEREYLDKDYRNTFSHFHSTRFNTPGSRVIRLHFFDERIQREDLRDQGKLQKHYCGYSIIRPTRPSSLGRTLLDPRKLKRSGGCARLCGERVILQSAELHVDGFPFISQDTDVTVCAHSALWMTFRYFSNRYSAYREYLPHQITSLTRDYSIGRLIPSGGLTDWQISEACRAAGFSPLIYSRNSFAKNARPEDAAWKHEFFEHLLYTYVESGIPVIAGVEDHAFVVFGHHSDYSLRPPSGSDPVFSSHFNTLFIINDDNRFPYQVVGRKKGCLASESDYSIGDIQSFIAPLPARLYLAAEDARKLVLALLQDGKFGLDPQSFKGERLVLRLFLTTVQSFKRALLDRSMGHPVVHDLYANLPMPHFVWVTEISTTSLYPDSVIGEIVWDATRNAHESTGWIVAHYPDRLIVDKGSALNRLPRLQSFPLDRSEPYPIFRSNLKEIG